MDLVEFIRNEVKVLPKEDQDKIMAEIEEMVKFEDSIGDDEEE